MMLDRVTAGPDRPRIALGAALAAVLGFVFFLLTVGAGVLDPGNIAWFDDGDARTQLLGWAFFGREPWTVPPAAVHGYGGPVASSIAYSDSLPLFALLLKPLAGLLPAISQITGWWLALCFVLQAVFGYLLVGLVDRRLTVRILGGCLFLLVPAFLFRATLHPSLCAHWLILAAIFLYFRPLSSSHLLFPLLLVAAGLAHIYLLAIVGGIWVAWLAAELLDRRPTGRVALDLVAGLAAVALGVWAAGYFTLVPTPGAGEFGLYPMNLLAPFDPAATLPQAGSAGDISAWSAVMPDLPNGPGDYEGFNYLGLGGLLLSIVLLMAALWRRPSVTVPRTLLPLLVMAVGLALFAVSTTILLGSSTVAVISLPEKVEQVLSLLHASGRMFWLAGYLLLLGGIWALARLLPRRILPGALAAVLVLQAGDLSPGLPLLRQDRVGTSWPDEPASPFWSCAAERYDRVNLIPGGNLAPGWDVVGLYAARHGLTTNSGYWRVVDSVKNERMQSEIVYALLSGELDPHAFYVLDQSTAALAAETKSPDDLLTVADGRIVLAPRWDAATCAGFSPTEVPTVGDGVPEIPLGREMDFSPTGGGAPFLGYGWSIPDEGGVWSDDPVALLLMRTPASLGGNAQLRLRADAYLAEARPTQDVAVRVNGAAVADLHFDRDHREQEFVIPLPPEALRRHPDHLLVSLTMGEDASPAELGMSPDPRHLGLLLKGLRLDGMPGPEGAATLLASGSLHSPFWACATERYRRLQFVASNDSVRDWDILRLYAADHGLEFSSYLATPESVRPNALLEGVVDPGTLYVLDRGAAPLAADFLPDDALFSAVDEWTVLAPGWNSKDCPRFQPAAVSLTPEPLPSAPMGEALAFAPEGNGVPLLGPGWSAPEPWGIWSSEAAAWLRIGLPQGTTGPVQLRLQTKGFVADGRPDQVVDVHVNGVEIGRLRFDLSKSAQDATFDVPESVRDRRAGSLVVRFDISNPTSPESLGLSEDKRRLGLGLTGLEIVPAP